MKKIIVVGAGILGASTAYHLSKLGAEVIIVDREDEGVATDVAAGIVCPWLSQRRNKAWYQLVKAGAKYYPELIEQLEADGEKETGYERVGAISLHTDHEKLEKMVERAQKKREDAPEIGDIQILSPDETKKLFPPLAEEYSAVYVSGAARVNGASLRKALIQGAVKNGAEFINGDASLLQEGKKIAGVMVDGKEHLGDRVVVTAGAWARSLIQPLGIELAVTAQKAQIVHLEIKSIDTNHWPVVMPPNDQYMLAFENGRVVIGATHEDEVGLDYRVTAGGVYEVLHKALKIAPGLEDATFVQTKVGFRPFTPGFLPVIGPLPGFEGILLANGLGASGLTSGPFLGAELARLSLGLQPEIDLSPYDVSLAIDQ
jgi:D-amino-acid dehydrogenase